MSNASRFPTAAKYALGFILGTALLITAAYLIENWLGDRAWAAEQRRLRELNLPLTFDELVPPMPPDEENFAMSPIMAPLFDITYTDPDNPVDRGAVWNQEGKRQQLQDLGASITAVLSSGPWMWMHGRPADLAAMKHEFREKPNEVGARPGMNASERASLRAAFRAIEPELAAVEEALQRPNAQFPLVHEHHVQTMLPHLPVLRNLSVLYAYRAEFALADIDSSAALENMLNSFKINNSLETQPLFLTLVVRTRMIDRSIQPVWGALRTSALSEDQLRRLQEELTVIDLIKHATSAISGERLQGCLIIDDIRSFGADVVDPPLLIKLVPKGWLQRSKALYSQWLEINAGSLIDSNNHRYHPERVRKPQAALYDEMTFWFDRRLAMLLAPSLTALEFAAIGQTHVDLARTAVALERHYLANRSYPETLDALEPDFIETVPHDVMTGEPLRYRRENGRFLLYSVGVNQVDDGGTVVPWGSGTNSPPDPDQGDIVWSYFPLVEKPEE